MDYRNEVDLYHKDLNVLTLAHFILQDVQVWCNNQLKVSPIISWTPGEPDPPWGAIGEQGSSGRG